MYDNFIIYMEKELEYRVTYFQINNKNDAEIKFSFVKYMLDENSCPYKVILEGTSLNLQDMEIYVTPVKVNINHFHFHLQDVLDEAKFELSNKMCFSEFYENLKIKQIKF